MAHKETADSSLHGGGCFQKSFTAERVGAVKMPGDKAKRINIKFTKASFLTICVSGNKGRVSQKFRKGAYLE